MISLMRLTLVLATSLATLFTSACAPSGPVPAALPERVTLLTVSATLTPEPMVGSPLTAVATLSPTSTNTSCTNVPTATPSQRPPTASQTPALATTTSPVLTVPSATPSPRPTPTDVPSAVTRNGEVRITIVYDNNAHDERLSPAWGFSCLVERGDLTLLFDTGGDAPTLLSNMETLGLAPTDIETVVLSHVHADHIGGVEGILAVNDGTTVYLPYSFPTSLKKRIGADARVVEVHEPMEIAEGIYTTGEMGGDIIEQSLVLVTHQGLVIITGCAHPGIVSIVERAIEVASPNETPAREAHLVMGGFHLVQASQHTIEHIVDDFRRLGVQKVAPCHCSGDLARSIFERAYGENFIIAGVGSSLEVCMMPEGKTMILSPLPEGSPERGFDQETVWTLRLLESAVAFASTPEALP
jgi:7,8-dihydropterin-6-yl-methyl-4-(beta-D-ribofuranosyl)aminobenzene 5'-phosphate synthase